MYKRIRPLRNRPVHIIKLFIINTNRSDSLQRQQYQVSISPTIYEQLFRTKAFQAAFL